MDHSTLETTAEQAHAPPPDACPKCGKALVDPGGLGWCSGCGYCKSLNEDERLVEEAKRRPSLGGVVEAGGAVAGLPAWFWACLLFVGVGVGFSIYNGNRLPAGDNLPRALWCTLQIASGFLMMFVAQICALIAIAPEEPTLTFKDAVFPFKLWPLVCKRLPRFKECLWAAILGVSLLGGSFVFIGGLQHWFTYMPKSAAQKARLGDAENAVKGEILIVPVD